MKIKRIVFALTFMLCLSSVTYATTFSDVPASHWAYQKIETMKNKGIISGFEDGTFRPQSVITREQFASILDKALENTSQSAGDIIFEDVSADRWSKKSIDAVSKYLKGYNRNGKKYFKPTAYAIREEMAEAVVKARGLEDYVPDYDTLSRFSDSAHISSKAKKYVAIAVENGLMSGNADGTFNPRGNLTRAEVVSLMYTFLDENVINDLGKHSALLWSTHAKVLGNGMYKPGENVTLTVSPYAGYTYEHIERSSLDIRSLEINHEGRDTVIKFKMPNKAVEITVKMKKIETEKKEDREYSVDVVADNSEVIGDGMYKPGEKVTVKVIHDEGYTFCTFDIAEMEREYLGDRTILKFRMPKKDVRLEIRAGRVTKRHVNVKVNNATVDGIGWYYPGDTVTISITPDDGYSYKRIEKIFDISAVKVKKLGDTTTITFTMPITYVDIEVLVD